MTRSQGVTTSDDAPLRPATRAATPTSGQVCTLVRHRWKLPRTVETCSHPCEGMACTQAHPTLPTGVGHLQRTLPGKAAKKPLECPTSDEKLPKKPPKFHINAINLQKNPPSPASMPYTCKKTPNSHIDATKHPVLPRCCRRGVCYVPPSRPGLCLISLWVKSLSCLRAAGRVGGSMAAVGVLSPTLQRLRLTREQYLAGRQSHAYEVRSHGAVRSHSHNWAATRSVARARRCPEELEAANTTTRPM